MSDSPDETRPRTPASEPIRVVLDDEPDESPTVAASAVRRTPPPNAPATPPAAPLAPTPITGVPPAGLPPVPSVGAAGGPAASATGPVMPRLDRLLLDVTRRRRLRTRRFVIATVLVCLSALTILSVGASNGGPVGETLLANPPDALTPGSIVAADRSDDQLLDGPQRVAAGLAGVAVGCLLVAAFAVRAPKARVIWAGVGVLAVLALLLVPSFVGSQAEQRRLDEVLRSDTGEGSCHGVSTIRRYGQDVDEWDAPVEVLDSFCIVGYEDLVHYRTTSGGTEAVLSVDQPNVHALLGKDTLVTSDGRLVAGLDSDTFEAKWTFPCPETESMSVSVLPKELTTSDAIDAGYRALVDAGYDPPALDRSDPTPEQQEQVVAALESIRAELGLSGSGVFVECSLYTGSSTRHDISVLSASDGDVVNTITRYS